MRLRTKVTLFFGLIALIASVSLTVVTYAFARSSLLEQRAEVARQQAVLNARRVREVLRDGHRGLRRLLHHDPHRDATASPPSASATTSRRARTPSSPTRASPPTCARPSASASRRCSASTLGDDHYVGVGIHIADVDADYFEAFQLGSTESTLRTILLALVIGTRHHGAAGHRRRAGGRAGACSARSGGSPTPPARSPPATSTRASPARAIPTSTGSPTRSTTWPTPCRPASSARPASPPTSATSCAPRSPPWPPPPRSSTAGAASSPTAPSRRSTSSSARCAASTPWSSTCSSCRASTPGRPTCTLEEVDIAALCARVAARNGFADLPDRRRRPTSATARR